MERKRERKVPDRFKATPARVVRAPEPEPRVGIRKKRVLKMKIPVAHEPAAGGRPDEPAAGGAAAAPPLKMQRRMPPRAARPVRIRGAQPDPDSSDEDQSASDAASDAASDGDQSDQAGPVQAAEEDKRCRKRQPRKYEAVRRMPSPERVVFVPYAMPTRAELEQMRGTVELPAGASSDDLLFMDHLFEGRFVYMFDSLELGLELGSPDWSITDTVPGRLMAEVHP